MISGKRLIWSLFTLLCATGAHAASLSIHIRPVFAGKPLVADEQYINSHGDTFTVETFRCYLSNFSLVPTGHQKPYAATGTFLVDLDKPASFIISLDVPADEYSELQFIIGVDSAANVSGANAGALDPAMGMYWAWNSGYIMAKLEGKSNVCKTLHHAFEFHIGGYLSPYNAARQVILPYKVNVVANGNNDLYIDADIAAWFAGGVDLSVTNSVLIPGKEACAVADRYAKMFSISANGNK